MIGDLSDMNKDSLLDTRATYIYSGTSSDGTKSGRFLRFEKDSDGVWRITSF
jgi:hypothetical protein